MPKKSKTKKPGKLCVSKIEVRPHYINGTLHILDDGKEVETHRVRGTVRNDRGAIIVDGNYLTDAYEGDGDHFTGTFTRVKSRVFGERSTGADFPIEIVGGSVVAGCNHINARTSESIAIEILRQRGYEVTR